MSSWPSIEAYVVCQCEAWTVAGVPHMTTEHSGNCSGTWGWNPPCGGCINCIAAQACYYRNEDRKHYQALPWWKKLITRRPL